MRQKQDLLSQSLECFMYCVVLVTFARKRKRKKNTVQADSQGHVSHYHELMSRVWPVNAYFLLKHCWHCEWKKLIPRPSAVVEVDGHVV